MKSKHLLLTLLLALLVPWAANAQKALPYSYGFEDNNLATDGWTLYGSTSSSTKIYSEADAPEGSYLFKFYYSEQSAHLVSPLLTGTGTGVDVTFQYMRNTSSSGYAEKFKVGYTTDESVTNPTLFTYGDEVTCTKQWETYEGTFPPGTKRIAIKYIYTNGMYLRLDDFNFTVPSCCTKPTDLTCTGTTGTPATATFTWTNGGEETQWLLEYALDEDFTNPTQVTVNQSDLVNGAYTLNGLTTETQYYARIKAWCPNCGAAGEYSKASNTCPFKPTNAVFIGNGTNTTGIAPLYGNYKSNYDQMIYTASQLDAVGINADGTISKIGFKSSATNTYKRNVKIYMGHTDKTEFSSNTDFVAYDDLQLVYDYSATGNSQWDIIEGWNEFELDTPFEYDGTSNLVIAVHCGWISSYSSSSFYCTQTTNNQVVYAYTDTQNYDPIPSTFNPTTSSASKGISNQLPNLEILFAANPTPKPKNLAVSNITSSGATLAWDAPTTATPTSYQYQYKEGEGEWTALQSTTNLSVALSLSASKTYTFQVRATYDGVGESAFVETSFTTLDNCAFPTNLLAYTVPGQGTKATLTWVKGYDEEAWVLQYGTDANFTDGTYTEKTSGFIPQTEPGLENVVAAVLTDLTAETKYYARVKADCDGPTSAWSNVAEFTPTNYVDFPYNANATSATSYTPFYGGYAANGTHSRFIIPSSSLADLAGGTVRKLTFYSSATTADWGAATFKVYVAEVEASSFTSNPSTSTPFDWSDMTQVYSGSLSLANGEMVILLDEPFVYSGTKNLMIGFEETNKGTNATAAWYYKSGVSNSCAYAYKTYASATSFTTSRGSYSPKMTFNYRPTATPRPIITVPVTTTDVTATIAWTKPSDNVTGYKYQYKLASATEWPTSWTELNDANAVSVTVPNLTPNTNYNFQIKAVYAEGESVASSTSFATACPVATPVPYTYGFETAPEFNCWEVTSSVSNGVRRTNSYAHVGNYSLVFYGTQLNEIEMPLFNQPTNTLRLEYWVRPEGYQDSRSGSFAIGYYNANDEFVALKTYEFNTTTGQYDDWESTVYIKQSIDFDVDADNDGTPDVPDNANIVLRQFNTTSNYYWMVDDVKVKVIPTCADVNDVHYVSFTNHSATIAWTAEAAQAAWQIAYKAGANFDPYNAEELATATIVDVTSNPYLFDKNLEAATTYYMYVRGNCGDVDGLGDWSDSYATFTTKAAAPAPSNFTASNLGSRTADLVWTAGGGDYETSWELYYVASATDPTAPDNETEANKTVNTLPTTEEPYTLGGLTPETRYYIWVRANHGTTDGKSAWTALTGGYFTTDVACHAPTNVAASSITNNSAEISWEGDANGYNIRYREYVVPTETLYDFENGMGEWTTIDADNDGFNWVLGSQAEVYLYEGNLSGNGYNGSSDLIASGSYRNTSSSGEELYPDNYLVSPMVTLGGTISFYACGTDDDYYAEHFGVFVSTNSNNDPNDFVMVNEWTATSTSYTQYTADLSAYSGQGYVAIRHFNCSNQFVLCVDNITIADPVTEQPWTLIENVTSPQPIPGLTAETTYEVQVQAVCGGEDGESVWTSLAEPFTTLSNCSAPGELNATDITSTSATLSWTGAQDKYNVRYSKLVAGPEVTISEDFESYEANNYSATSGDRPSDWAYSTGNTSGYFTPQVSNNDLLAPSYYGISGMSGQGNILYMLGAHNYAVMPRIENLTSFTFKYAFENASNGTFKVGYVTDASNISGSFNQFENVTTSGTTTLTTVTLTSTELDILNSTDGARLAFNFNYSSSYGFAIDDISYTTQSFTPEAWNEDNVNVTSPLPINGLEMGTSYVWEVQGINAGCGDEGLTEWSALANFATPYPSFTREITGYGENAGGYVLIASPLAGETDPANVTNMIPTVAANYDLYYFDQAQDLEWINYKDTENGGYNLINGKGYLYANKNTVTLTFTGAPGTNGTVTLNLTENVEFEGLNLVGNPFGVQAYISKPYYRMEEGGAEIMSTPSSDAINVMEGVFVIADTDGEELTFSTTPNPIETANLNLNLSQANRVIDRAIVSFGKGEQLPKFQLNKSNTKVYIPVEGKDYAIANAESNVGEMPVSFEAKNNGTYTLSFTNEEVSFAYLHLIDNMTGIETDLLANPSYTFEARTTDYASRFKLVFATGSSTGSDTFAYYSNGNWVINNEGRATLQVVDVNGRILKSESINGCANVNFKAAAGIYMIRLVNGDNVKVQKVVVR